MKMQPSNLYSRPVKLVPNRIYRSYPGGREIEKFRGNTAEDDLAPEAWVGSTTLTFNHDRFPGGKLGYAQAYIGDQMTAYLKDIIDLDPVSFLGKKHVSRFGSDISVLVKLLDTQKQLGLQCHPNRRIAKQYFNSDYGKVESWYILGLREDQEGKPYLLLGFKKGITRAKFQELFLKGDITGMENCCHKIYPRVGEMYYVAAGVPHALGPGCFAVEVQEPSDITVGARLIAFEDEAKRQAFTERTMISYDYTGRNAQDNLKAFRVEPKVLCTTPGGSETLLLGSTQTSYFGVTRVDVDGRMRNREAGTFSIAIVIEGTGSIKFAGGSMDVKKGDEIFLPAGVEHFYWEAKKPMHIICCYPPEVL